MGLLRGVLIPDPYERLVSSLGSKSAADQLAKSARADAGRYPRRVFRPIAALRTPTRPFFSAIATTRESLLPLDIADAEAQREALVQLTAEILDLYTMRT